MWLTFLTVIKVHTYKEHMLIIIRAFWIEVDNKGIWVFIPLVTSEFLSYRPQDEESFHEVARKSSVVTMVR